MVLRLSGALPDKNTVRILASAEFQTTVSDRILAFVCVDSAAQYKAELVDVFLEWIFPKLSCLERLKLFW